MENAILKVFSYLFKFLESTKPIADWQCLKVHCGNVVVWKYIYGTTSFFTFEIPAICYM